MANIRGFGDLNNNRGPVARGGGGGGGGNGDGGGNDPDAISNLLGFTRDTGKDPRNETFFDMIHYSFTPALKLRSFTAFIGIGNILIFIVTLAMSGIYTPGDFLQLNSGWVLNNFAENGMKIRQDYQYWRLITSTVLHLSFLHIVMNTFSLLVWGSFIESFTGTKKYMIIYWVSGVCGDLLSCAVNNNNNNSVGASGCIMGVTGSLIGLLILNWMVLSEPRFERIRGMLTCIVIMICLFSLMSIALPGNSNKSIATTDNYAHLGGFCAGFFLSMAIGRVFAARDGSYEKKTRNVGWALMFVLLASTILPIAFTSGKPKQI